MTPEETEKKNRSN